MKLSKFKIDFLKKNKPPKDNSLKTLSEIQDLNKIPINKDFIKKNNNKIKKLL